MTIKDYLKTLLSNLKTTLVISHLVHLTDEEMKKLSYEKVKVTGIYSPVTYINGFTSEPAVKVPCNYILGISNCDMKTNKEGFNIGLSNIQIQDLQKRKFMAFWFKETIKKDIEIFVDHQVVISNKDDLERSICLFQRSQTSSN